jgi:hypothetical protein
MLTITSIDKKPVNLCCGCGSESWNLIEKPRG